MNHFHFIWPVNRSRAWGRRERPSQLACRVVPRNSVRYEKATTKRHQRCILAAAVTDTALPGSIIYFKGCWSVTKVKLRPSRYVWNFFTPQTRDRDSFFRFVSVFPLFQTEIGLHKQWCVLLPVMCDVIRQLRDYMRSCLWLELKAVRGHKVSEPCLVTTFLPPPGNRCLTWFRMTTSRCSVITDGAAPDG